MSIDKTIKDIQTSFNKEFPTIASANALEEIRIKFLGRKGLVNDLFEMFNQLPGSEKPKYGKSINILKSDITLAIEKKQANFQTNNVQSNIDLSLPGIELRRGSIHPLEEITSQIKSIFQSIGFSIAYGPEIDDEYHNFEALNVPKHHPARDMQDTYYIDPETVLRTHTSNVQIHLMENQQPPLRHICVGRVFRNEAVSYKSFCLFNQVEGLVVNEFSSFAQMKGTIEYFISEMFGSNTKMRFRPSYFPFTEPSAEVDIWNDKLQQWMEIMGCGMVNPKVFENVGYPSNAKGYAFGMGIERIAMIKYGISDIRLFYQNDQRFLEQF